MSKAFSFNLIEEPWIPCVRAGATQPDMLGLRDVFARAGEIEEVVDPSPLVTISLHRLLLAILHRCFGPRNAQEWAKHWKQGAWDKGVLGQYLTTWQARFDLFDEEYPFYQTPGLDPDYAGTITKLTHELASPANKALLFDHTVEGTAAFSPAQAARYLLACQSFHVGGLVSLHRYEDKNTHKSASASPLTKGAVTLVKGINLFGTLMLNLHQYSPASEEPFHAEPDDAPAWERDQPTSVGERHPRGYLDLLTWQSRRILLYPETHTRDTVCVRKVTIMKGYQFPDVDERHNRETMLAFRRNEKAPMGHDPWPVIQFREGRSAWRDSLALFQSVSGQHDRPKVLTWLDELADKELIDRSSTFPLQIYGMSTDQANVLFWRHERLPLPLAYLSDEVLLGSLRLALELTEQVAGALRGGIRRLAELSLAPDSDVGGRAAHGADVTSLASSYGVERLYWSQLEGPFKRLLVDLEQDRHVDDPAYPEEVSYGIVELPLWGATVGQAAWKSFNTVTRSLNTSARDLKAAALAERQFNGQMRKLIAKEPWTPRKQVAEGETG